jgi:hypothetical protein
MILTKLVSKSITQCLFFCLYFVDVNSTEFDILEINLFSACKKFRTCYLSFYLGRKSVTIFMELKLNFRLKISLKT